MLAIISGGAFSPAIAGGGAEQGFQPPLRGSYCEGSGQDLTAPARPGCARISGYITAGDRSDGRIGGRPEWFAPLDGSGIGARSGAPGLTIVGAPPGGDRFLPPRSAGDIAR